MNVHNWEMENIVKHFAYTLAVAGMVGSMGTLAAAQSDVDPATTTCADFMAMSAEDQRSALAALQRANPDKSENTSASTDGMDGEADISGDTDAATSMSDDTASESADADTSMDTDSDTSTDTNSATTDSNADASTSSDAQDPGVQAMIAACEGNEGALAVDQVSPK